jgi:hypothetical protein
MEKTIDFLQVKIEKAKMQLPKETLQAINNVKWENIILSMKESKNLNFTQVEDLLLETELVLCGLVKTEDYPKEITNRLRIPKAKTDEIINELNEKVFKKIRQELIKIKELNQKFGNREQILSNNTEVVEQEAPNKEIEKQEKEILTTSGIDLLKEETPKAVNKENTESNEENLVEKRGEMLENITNPEEIKNNPKIANILEKRLNSTFTLPQKNTEQKEEKIDFLVKKSIPKIDPYREIPE